MEFDETYLQKEQGYVPVAERGFNSIVKRAFN